MSLLIKFEYLSIIKELGQVDSRNSWGEFVFYTLLPPEEVLFYAYKLGVITVNDEFAGNPGVVQLKKLEITLRLVWF